MQGRRSLQKLFDDQKTTRDATDDKPTSERRRSSRLEYSGLTPEAQKNPELQRRARWDKIAQQSVTSQQPLKSEAQEPEQARKGKRRQDDPTELGEQARRVTRRKQEPVRTEIGEQSAKVQGKSARELRIERNEIAREATRKEKEWERIQTEERKKEQQGQEKVEWEKNLREMPLEDLYDDRDKHPDRLDEKPDIEPIVERTRREMDFSTRRM